MEKAFAYICAAQDAAPRLLRRYCHKVYELGYVPICPKLSLPQYLSADVPEEQRAMSQISQQLLRRCRMLVVCGGEITAAMAGEILPGKTILEALNTDLVGGRDRDSGKAETHLHHAGRPCENQGGRTPVRMLNTSGIESAQRLVWLA